MPHPSDLRDPLFLETVDKITRNMGKKSLDDDDIVLLACEEISRTVTHEEKNYQAPPRNE